MKPYFVHIPKTAGRSIKEVFKQLNFNYLTNEGHCIIDKHYLSKDFYKFCFCRNPYDRIVSAFFHLISIDTSGVTSSKFEKKRALLKEAYGNDFNSFILDRGFEKIQIAHFYPQSRWLLYEGVFYMDDIYRFESLSSEWDRLSKKFSLKAGLPHSNKTQFLEDKNKLSFYTQASLDIVSEYYISDFKLLGYPILRSV